MRFNNFFMVDKEEKSEVSLKEILLDINSINEEWNIEDNVFSQRITFSSIALFISLFNVSGFFLHQLGLYSITSRNFVGVSFLGGLLGFAVSLVLLMNVSAFKLPFSKKLKTINKKIENNRVLMVKLLNTKKFQKEVINSLFILEKSSYTTNEDQIYIKKFKNDIAQHLQNNELDSAAEMIENHSTYLSELLETQESNIQQEKEVANYLKQFEESEVQDNNTSHVYASKGSIDYRKMI